MRFILYYILDFSGTHVRMRVQVATPLGLENNKGIRYVYNAIKKTWSRYFSVCVWVIRYFRDILEAAKFNLTLFSGGRYYRNFTVGTFE